MILLHHRGDLEQEYLTSILSNTQDAQKKFVLQSETLIVMFVLLRHSSTLPPTHQYPQTCFAASRASSSLASRMSYSSVSKPSSSLWTPL